jgi:GT2 family glycosyltransferase
VFITLVVPTITQYDRLLTMLETVHAGTRVPDKIVVLNNGKEWQLGAPFTHLYNIWHTNPENKGVAGSCNQALSFASAAQDGWWLHANDDIEISPTIIADLEHAASITPNELVFCPLNNGGSAFTFFLMHARKALKEIGLWDEPFFPSYYEDNDYAYRMGLKGYKWVPVDGGHYIHHTSSTLKSYTPEQMDEHHINFRRNRQRYIDKWGTDVDEKGDPVFGSERYTVPFNGVQG